VLGRLVGYPALVRLVAAVGWPLYLLVTTRGRRLREDLSPRRLGRLRDAAPPRLAAAVDEGGGLATLQTSLQRYFRVAVPATVATYLVDEAGARPHLPVVGEDVLAEAVAAGPVMLLTPHVGAWDAVTPWLLSRGYRVAGLGVAANPYPRLSRLVVPSVVARRFLYIDVRDRLAIARAVKALRQGYIFTWPGDARTGYGADTRTITIDYLGKPTSVTPLPFHLHRRIAPTYVLGVAPLSDGAPPTICLRFDRVDITADSEQGHVEALYDCIGQAIVEHYRQWSLWRMFDKGRVLGGV
jgi:lauroyl/myristoyl acyltransferase